MYLTLQDDANDVVSGRCMSKFDVCNVNNDQYAYYLHTNVTSEALDRKRDDNYGAPYLHPLPGL